MQTYTRTITPERGDPFDVTLRPLMAGDRADIQDAVRVEMEDEEGEGQDVKINMGRMQVLTVSRALVSWTRSELISELTVRMLPPDVFDAIYANTAWGYVPEEAPAGDPSQPSSDSSETHDGDSPADGS